MPPTSFAHLREDGRRPDHAIGSRRKVGAPERSKAAQLIALPMAGVALEKEAHVRVAPAFRCDVRDARPQAVLVRTRPHNASARIIGLRVPAPSQRVDHISDPVWSELVVARIELMKK